VQLRHANRFDRADRAGYSAQPSREDEGQAVGRDSAASFGS